MPEKPKSYRRTDADVAAEMKTRRKEAIERRDARDKRENPPVSQPSRAGNMGLAESRFRRKVANEALEEALDEGGLGELQRAKKPNIPQALDAAKKGFKKGAVKGKGAPRIERKMMMRQERLEVPLPPPPVENAGPI